MCQEVFLTVHRKLPAFEGRSSVLTWRYGICVRVVADYRKRREDATPRTKLEALAAEPAPSGQQDDPVAIRQARAKLDAILDRLDRLDDAKRAVFVLYADRRAFDDGRWRRHWPPDSDGIFAPACRARRSGCGRRPRASNEESFQRVTPRSDLDIWTTPPSCARRSVRGALRATPSQDQLDLRLERHVNAGRGGAGGSVGGGLVRIEGCVRQRRHEGCARAQRRRRSSWRP